MDDLLALLGEDCFEEVASPSAVEASVPKLRRAETSHRSGELSGNFHSGGDRFRKVGSESKRETNSADKIALSVDDRIGIRMTNRLISGVDLLEMISDNPYHSTAQLSSYSLIHMNRILTEPASIVDVATVCGRTNLITVGLVFSNSGTRVSKSGNAYCVFTIGNLNTGPAVSVMLFGATYSKYCRPCKPGHVVALMSPRLLPSSSPNGVADSATAVSFSVSDEEQIRMVADARDFDFCKGNTRGKNENGKWVNDVYLCRHFVDKRLGEFCQTHRKQEKINGQMTVARGGVTASTSSLQKLRLDSQSYPTAVGNKMRANLDNCLNPPSKENSRACNLQQRQTGNALRLSKQDKKLAINSLLNPNPKRPATTNLHSAVNPYTRYSNALPRCPTITKKNVPAMEQNSISRNLVLSDLLKQSKPKRKRDGTTITGQKKRTVNTDTGGFNGSVPIPAPSTIFDRRQVAKAIGQGSRTATNHEKSSHEIIAKQIQLASLMRESKSSAENRRLHTYSSNGYKQQTKKQSLQDSLFGDLPMKIDSDMVLATKSRFASEADAEDYARSRRIVNGLEEEEAKKDRKTKDPVFTSIQKEWRCKTCNRTYTKHPFDCKRLRHNVQVTRDLRTSKTVEEQRLALTETNSEDGGLKLGSGLNWSRFS
jgi:hypothetical protein